MKYLPITLCKSVFTINHDVFVSGTNERQSGEKGGRLILMLHCKCTAYLFTWVDWEDNETLSPKPSGCPHQAVPPPWPSLPC